MLKVFLLLVLFNSETGELKGLWQPIPSFETIEQCEEVLKNEVPKFNVPEGLSLSAQCIDPSAVSKGIKTTTST